MNKNWKRRSGQVNCARSATVCAEVNELSSLKK